MKKIKKDIGNIICPECKKLAFLNINEDNIIKIDNCISQHKSEYSINEFIENQEIKENDIKCDICKNNKYFYNDKFYICTCKKNICQLCRINHIKDKEEVPNTEVIQNNEEIKNNEETKNNEENQSKESDDLDLDENINMDDDIDDGEGDLDLDMDMEEGEAEEEEGKKKKRE